MADNRQSDAQAAMAARGAAVGLPEAFENMGKQFRVDAFSIVGNSKLHATVRVREFDANFAALGRKLDRV